MKNIAIVGEKSMMRHRLLLWLSRQARKQIWLSETFYWHKIISGVIPFNKKWGKAVSAGVEQKRPKLQWGGMDYRLCFVFRAHVHI